MLTLAPATVGLLTADSQVASRVVGCVTVLVVNVFALEGIFTVFGDQGSSSTHTGVTLSSYARLAVVGFAELPFAFVIPHCCHLNESAIGCSLVLISVALTWGTR